MPLPTTFEKSLQARFLIPMAVSLGFGVLFATGITLILIPCLYMILDDLHVFSERISGRASGLRSGSMELGIEGLACRPDPFPVRREGT
jgi:hypothetical protein